MYRFKEQALSETTKCLLALLGLGIVVLMVYGNSLSAEWHYDDHFNILDNANLRLSDLSWENLSKTFYFNGRLSRPVAYFSFALNYYFGGYDVWGYHLINVLIHLFTTCLLFIFIYKTLHLPAIKDAYANHAFIIALLSTLLWAVHPIHVHAVTTIVQRMASLTGLFYISAMLFYLEGRLAGKNPQRAFFFLAAFCSAILALGTKENAVMIPLALLLYDYLLIQGVKNNKAWHNAMILFGLFIIMMIVVINFFDTNLMSLLNGYDIRPFSLGQRLLTEIRIVIYYISLLIYPIASRLTLLHDIELSQTLFDPWTTLPAILMVVMLFTLAIRWSRSKPLISFGLLFFFLNHLVEGSFIPLELIYEHRNYIPSMFFFIPVAFMMVHTLHYFSYSRNLKTLFIICFALLFLLLGHTVFSRNKTINTAYGLWLDNVKKAPALSRAHNNLGEVYWNKGIQGMACLEFDRAYKNNNETNRHQFGVICSNLGNCYFNIVQDLAKAESLYRQALHFYPGLPPAISGLGLVALKRGQNEKAKGLFYQALQNLPEDPEFLHNLALVFYMEGDSKNAVAHAQKALLFSSNDLPALMLLGRSYCLRGDFKRSAGYWEAYDSIKPGSVLAKLALIELYDLLKEDRPLQKTVIKLRGITQGKTIDEITQIALQENPGFIIYNPSHALVSIILPKHGFSSDLR